MRSSFLLISRQVNVRLAVLHTPGRQMSFNPVRINLTLKVSGRKSVEIRLAMTFVSISASKSNSVFIADVIYDVSPADA